MIHKIRSVVSTIYFAIHGQSINLYFVGGGVGEGFYHVKGYN